MNNAQHGTVRWITTLALGAALLAATGASAQGTHHDGHGAKADTTHHAAKEDAHHDEAAHAPAIQASRPGLAEYTGTVGKGTLQVEGGYSLLRVKKENSHALGEVLVRYGVGARTELRLGLNSYTRGSDHGHEVSGVQDSDVGVKWTVTEGRALLPSAALIVSTSVPTGSDAIGSDTWQPEAGLSLGWTLPAHLSLTTSGTYLYAMDDHHHRVAELTSATSLGLELTHALHVHGEYAFSAPTDHFSEKLHHVSGGFGYHLTEDLQVDVWAGGASAHGERELLFGFGLARRW